MEDTICALSTPQGMGAIAMIRLSGPDTFNIFSRVFTPIKKGSSLLDAPPYSMLFGKIHADGKTIDEVMVGIFRNPNSYTGEDVIEISCHGSVYIQKQIIQLLLKNGARLAEPGEYTMRAFANGKMDLSQAEAVADLIASESQAAHQVAMQQMRGGFSKEIAELRQELINFASLIELELDFSEEDVEFADRTQLSELLYRIKTVLKRLIDSFDTGNVIKNGVPVAIVGAPNVGKSTLLNALLNEEKAIVSDIAGTTRDAIEDEISIEGIRYRFIDTAGIRETEDVVESIGIKKTFEKIDQSRLILYLFDAAIASSNPALMNQIKEEIKVLLEKSEGKAILLVANKMDEANTLLIENEFTDFDNLIQISALNRNGLDTLIHTLTQTVNLNALNQGSTIVTNLRHFDMLSKALEDVIRVEEGMQNQISGDFLAMDIREALKHLGSITGEITTDDLLGNIFGKFCIGK
jgi:tRNA modification GTPase